MIRFDHFMAQANAAYYATHDPFEDFTTAPELTQVFGEILGAWAKTVWQMMGAPPNIKLIEAGPGRGTLMADMRRVWPEPEIHLIETSPRLREEQSSRIADATWHDSLETVPPGPAILIANEFLDALPVRQFECTETGWTERFVENGAYHRQPAVFWSGDPPGSVREVSEARRAFVAALARRGAAALFIDYGPAVSAAGESVQAIRAGQYANVLENPGSADITAHVDFADLAAIARQCGAQAQGPIPQNRFLTALGLFQRSDRLAQKAPAMAEKLKRAAHRLTAPEAMGSLFKAMAVCPPNLPTLPGFEP